MPGFGQPPSKCADVPFDYQFRVGQTYHFFNDDKGRPFQQYQYYASKIKIIARKKGSVEFVYMQVQGYHIFPRDTIAKFGVLGYIANGGDYDYRIPPVGINSKFHKATISVNTEGFENFVFVKSRTTDEQKIRPYPFKGQHYEAHPRAVFAARAENWRIQVSYADQRLQQFCDLNRANNPNLSPLPAGALLTPLPAPLPPPDQVATIIQELAADNDPIIEEYIEAIPLPPSPTEINYEIQGIHRPRPPIVPSQGQDNDSTVITDMDCQICCERITKGGRRDLCALSCGHCMCLECCWRIKNTGSRGKLKCPFCNVMCKKVTKLFI